MSEPKLDRHMQQNFNAVVDAIIWMQIFSFKCLQTMKLGIRLF